jgi:uncharacterized protein (TIGR00251 family)
MKHGLKDMLFLSVFHPCSSVAHSVQIETVPSILMIQITEHPEGCVLSVRAHPGARRNGIQGEVGGCLKVAVTAPADRGKANQALLDVLAIALELRRSQIQVIGGLTQRQKTVLLQGCSKTEAEAKLAALLKTAG